MGRLPERMREGHRTRPREQSRLQTDRQVSPSNYLSSRLSRLAFRAYARMANVKTLQKEYEPALKYYNHSLSEHRNPEILTKKLEVEKILKEQQKLAYVDPVLAEEEKTKGNEFFQKADYPSALKHYT